MKDKKLYYDIGPLLYCPANNPSIQKSISNESFGSHYSVALCLEDTINDNYVEEAENCLAVTLTTIFSKIQTCNFYLPKIFIRVREPLQIKRIYDRLGCVNDILTGFIIPKFSMDNANEYIQIIQDINSVSTRPKYMMPIYESPSIIHLKTRYDILYGLKDKLKPIEELVLNIRVGGNDLCHIFGMRRSVTESIHQIRSIADIFSDIICVYGADYIISGPVWEYFSGELWSDGMIQEIKDDKLCGFTGKTVIHPKQIPIVNEMYKISRSDYNDALHILNWDKSNASFVSGNSRHERMDEYKTHGNWAKRILLLAESYGIREQTNSVNFLSHTLPSSS